jgi:undecaprenyl-phosphate 4-deoxy-4-formamido-L-arabinose transferase
MAFIGTRSGSLKRATIHQTREFESSTADWVYQSYDVALEYISVPVDGVTSNDCVFQWRERRNAIPQVDRLDVPEDRSLGNPDTRHGTESPLRGIHLGNGDKAMTSCTLSIVIPVYRGEKTVGELVHALSGLQISGGYEIVLVNDGSPDNSLAVCRELLRTCPVPITLVNLARNFGEHNAVLTGLRHARGAWAITMDDDMQNPPSEIRRILDYAQASGKDVVYTYYADKQHASWRNLGSRFTNFVADILLDKPKGLYLSSFRCINRLVIDNIISYTGPFPYVDGLVVQVTHNIGRIQVAHLPRIEGRSNYTLRRLVRLWLNMFVNFSVMPLHLSTVAGLTLSAIGTLAAISVIIESWFTKTPRGWGSVMSAVLLLSGVQLLILGLVGEYLGRMYLTANGKPQSVISGIERGEPELLAATKEPVGLGRISESRG